MKSESCNSYNLVNLCMCMNSIVSSKNNCVYAFSKNLLIWNLVSRKIWRFKNCLRKMMKSKSKQVNSGYLKHIYSKAERYNCGYALSIFLLIWILVNMKISIFKNCYSKSMMLESRQCNCGDSKSICFRDHRGSMLRFP